MAQGTVPTSQIGNQKRACIMHQFQDYGCTLLVAPASCIKQTHFQEYASTLLIGPGNPFPRVWCYFVGWIRRSSESLDQWPGWPVKQATKEPVHIEQLISTPGRGCTGIYIFVPQSDLSVGVLTVLYQGALPGGSLRWRLPGRKKPCNLQYLVTPTFKNTG